MVSPGSPPVEILEPELPARDHDLYRAAWQTARRHHGTAVTFYLPGMIRYGSRRGLYPAVSLTGDRCELMCEHCRGRLLEPMLKVADPPALVEMARRLKRRGHHGMLLTGGSDSRGCLPWPAFAGAIRDLHAETGFFLSAHTGFPDAEDCRLLKTGGVTQGLIDVMGDDETAHRIYHLPGRDRVRDSLAAIRASGLELIPHIVVGLYYGALRAEYDALALIREFDPQALVFVVLTPLAGTPMAGLPIPPPEEIGRLMATARLMLPEVPIALGCERPRNRHGWRIENLALLAGVTRISVWSDRAILNARRLGLKPRFQTTCCSLPYRPDFSSLEPQ